MQGAATQSTGGAQSPPLRILVVDNDEDNASVMSTLLRLKGHHVESSLSGRNAIAWVEVLKPELILLDILMPGMDGIEVARTVRSMPLVQQPVLAAWSGATAPRVRQACANAGIDHYLIKPVEESALDQLITLVSDASNARNEFIGLAERYEASVFKFIRLQLEFCSLVLGAPRVVSSEQQRFRNLQRVGRVLTLASDWMRKHPQMPSDDRYDLEEEIAKLQWLRAQQEG